MCMKIWYMYEATQQVCGNTARCGPTTISVFVPRLFSGEGKRAWYTLFAHAFN